jgi:hypothetical protein
MDKDAAREAFYRMPYSEWKDKYQTDATAEQQAAYVISHAKTHG